jgi:hypothetical protein
LYLISLSNIKQVVMKRFTPFIIVLIASILLSSCLKGTLQKSDQKLTKSDTINMLSGTWKVVNDTSTTADWGLWSGRPSTGSNYIGNPADYYKFTPNGYCYTSVNGVVDTGTYTESQDQINIVYTYFNEQETTAGVYNGVWTINKLTNNAFTFSVTFLTPETAATNVTNLTKN